MRKRLITDKYLRDVNKYNISILVDNDDYSVCVKNIIETSDPFVVSSGVKLIDNGYSIIEITPYSEFYSMKVFVDDQKNILQYYFDISLENGIDDRTKIPYYNDLYLDVTITDGVIEILDEEELDEALSSGDISKETYEFAHKITNELVDSIKSNSNVYMNLDLIKYL